MAKLFRKPSLKRVLGITKVKMNMKRSLGIYEVTKVINAPKNAKKRLQRQHTILNGLFKLLKALFK